ncbi:MAG: RNA 3'-terminal phosphate cyclase [Candidatus Aenigmatarchaeota archaeon]|nr:MAG: RNA 3'-terminal phosphate cyclase [Candidatus Aenigmarchaeota archaeon]
MISLDGSSGGGQILRTALGLSVVTKTPFRLTNIRGGREVGGLKTQHLEALKAIALLCDAEVTGAKLGSTEVTFAPEKITRDALDVEIGTAGSVGLVFQTLQLVPYVLKEPLHVHVRGGATYGKWAPPVDYITRVFLPVVKRFGYRTEFDVKREGFYPKGGADVTFVLHPPEGASPLLAMSRGKPVSFTDRGFIRGVHVYSVASTELKRARVAERQAAAAAQALKPLGRDTTVEVSYELSDNPGSGVVCYAEYEHTVLGGDAIGEKSVSAEDVGKSAAEKLLKAMDSGCITDRQTSDMILPFLALSGGQAHLQEVTNHVRTNIVVIEAFLGKRLELDGTTVRSTGS